MSKDLGTIDKEKDVGNVKLDKPAKKHFCPYVGCTYAFDRPWKLNRHLNTHTNERPFKCDYPGCTKGYTNNSHLQRHKVISHTKNKPTPEGIPCEFSECKKVFCSKWSMKRHCSSHYITNLKKIAKKEETCEKDDFPHKGVDFLCDLCKKSFKTSKELVLHIKKHKIYSCDHEGCCEKFISWNNLRSHIKIKHPDKYQCDFCKKFFTNKWTLTEHVLSHLPLDKRDVILCPYTNCNRHYFYERNLEAHIKSYHQNLNYKCEFNECGRIFTTKQKLNEHVRRHTEPTVRKKRQRVKLTEEEKKLRREKNPKKKNKSMAAALSGLVLPPFIDKKIAQNNITFEVLEYINKIKSDINEITQIS